MCTLTWRFFPDGYELWFSRDEHGSRQKGIPPSLQLVNNTRVVCGVDPTGGGTWLVTNERGLTLALLNRYPDKNSGHAAPSRGKLALDLAGHATSEEVVRDLKARDLSVYRPFDLMVFERGRSPAGVSWNGSALQMRLGRLAPATSSSWRSRAVTKFRRKLYAITVLGAPSSKALERFHRTRVPGFGAWSVAMRRKETSTVSLTQVLVDKTEAEHRYFDGDPTGVKVPFCARLSLTDGSDRPPATITPAPVAAPPVRLEAVLRSKGLLRGRRYPQIFWLALEEILGVGKLNRFLQRLGPVSSLSFAEAALTELGVEVIAPLALLELRAGEPAIYAANHPSGGVDGLAALAWLLRLHGHVVVPSNDVLGVVPQLKEYVRPIPRGKPSRALHEAIRSCFLEASPVLMFPAGRTARESGNTLQEFPWRCTVVTEALRHKRHVVPVHISGANSAFFYALAKLRTFVRVPWNLEMFTLLRETLSPAEKCIKISAGAALSPEEIGRLGQTARQRTDAIAKLSSGLCATTEQC